ncbi:flagellar biosynthesis protein FlhB [Magnetospira sp. QH-2]|uniref:flagellar biosynthesis protein FlhB n=1 Tax=Magnetospira sp. (strain QH-2) TaxID=1288970 RepID=UPI0003E81550|nr:flagellar biosynthesis protein FlhB [Magnetospira sp. QH-2]CCQ74104.1 Flagellar biosynthetic protein FlhB [Magnetospira sp. QH-2]
MAEDDSEKSEEPTDRKLSRAREEGQTASSQEIKSWGILAAGTLLMMTVAPGMFDDIKEVLRKFIESSSSIPLDFPHIHLMLVRTGQEVVGAVWPLFIILVLVALAVNLVQTGLIWAPKKIQPKLSTISPIAGFKRLFSLKAVMELVKGVFKIGVVTFVSVIFVVPMVTDMAVIPSMPLPILLDRLKELALTMLGATVVVTAVIAALDYTFQRWSYLKGLRMSQQEVKDEHKQTEGDPKVKSKIRSLRMQRARERMMAAVPQADVVITNPTHYSVAMKYDMEDMAAPVVVAKGIDEVALRIREVAEENDVPLIENAPLAQALYATVELDEEVPPEHYKAVAEVIGYVMRMKGAQPAAASAEGPVS